VGRVHDGPPSRGDGDPSIVVGVIRGGGECLHTGTLPPPVSSISDATESRRSIISEKVKVKVSRFSMVDDIWNQNTSTSR
jgi:hypothetical protein